MKITRKIIDLEKCGSIYIPKFKYDLQLFAETEGLFLADAEPAGGVGDFDGTSTEGDMSIAGIEAAQCHGSYGYKITYDGTNDLAYGYFTLSDLTELWVRMYVYLPSSLTPGGTWKQLYLIQLYDGASYAIRMGIQSNATPAYYTWVSQVSGQGLGQSATNFSLDAWHYIEVHWISDGEVGGASVKVDGSGLIITDEDQDTSGFAIDSARFGSTLNTAVTPANDYFYMDDIKGSSVDWVGPYSEAGGGRISRYHDLSGLGGHGQSTFNPLG